MLIDLTNGEWVRADDVKGLVPGVGYVIVVVGPVETRRIVVPLMEPFADVKNLLSYLAATVNGALR